MNIFILSEDPVHAAQQQCDKHVPKMIVESAQMLSTAHRMLDGIQSRRPSKSGKTLSKYWELPDAREAVLYKAVHMGHPCTVWTMESRANYVWHYIHFIALCDEYTYRYGKKHLSDLRLSTTLKNIPNSLEGDKRTPFKLAMGSNPECKFSDAVKSYRAFYQSQVSSL